MKVLDALHRGLTLGARLDVGIGQAKTRSRGMQRWACKSALRGGTVSACQCGARAQEFGHARSDPISLIRETNCLAGEIYNYQLF